VRNEGHQTGPAYAATREALAGLYPRDLRERRDRHRSAWTPGRGRYGCRGERCRAHHGSAAEGGFKGIAGRFARRGLLRFGVPIAADRRFTRLDTQASLEVHLRRAGTTSPDLMAALRKALSPEASADERERFASSWKARTAAMLLTSQASANEYAGQREGVLMGVIDAPDCAKALLNQARK
jgi:hypothetical protein